jgi:hypothetical protein
MASALNGSGEWTSVVVEAGHAPYELCQMVHPSVSNSLDPIRLDELDEDLRQHNHQENCEGSNKDPKTHKRDPRVGGSSGRPGLWARIGWIDA